MFPLALLRTTQWAPCTRRSRCRRHQQGLATSPTGPTQRVLSPDAAFPVKRPQPPSLRRPIRLRGVTVILTCRRAAAQRRPLPLQPSAFPTWRWLVGCPGCLLGSEMPDEVPIAQNCAFSGGISHSYPRGLLVRLPLDATAARWPSDLGILHVAQRTGDAFKDFLAITGQP